jgi:hypothetical protein
VTGMLVHPRPRCSPAGHDRLTTKQAHPGQGPPTGPIYLSRDNTARHVKGLAPTAGTFARISDGHLGPATTSSPVTPRRIGGRDPATSITSITLSYGRGEAERSPSRLYGAADGPDSITCDERRCGCYVLMRASRQRIRCSCRMPGRPECPDRPEVLADPEGTRRPPRPQRWPPSSPPFPATARDRRSVAAFVT